MDDRSLYRAPGTRGAYGCDPVTPAEAAEMFASAQRALQRLHRPVASVDGGQSCGWCHRLYPCPGALGTEPGADQPSLRLVPPPAGSPTLGGVRPLGPAAG